MATQGWVVGVILVAIVVVLVLVGLVQYLRHRGEKMLLFPFSKRVHPPAMFRRPGDGRIFMTSSTKDVIIYFTTDGSKPNPNSQQYAVGSSMPALKRGAVKPLVVTAIAVDKRVAAYASHVAQKSFEVAQGEALASTPPSGPLVVPVPNILISQMPDPEGDEDDEEFDAVLFEPQHAAEISPNQGFSLDDLEQFDGFGSPTPDGPANAVKNDDEAFGFYEDDGSFVGVRCVCHSSWRELCSMFKIRGSCAWYHKSLALSTPRAQDTKKKSIKPYIVTIKTKAWREEAWEEPGKPSDPSMYEFNKAFHGGHACITLWRQTLDAEVSDLTDGQNGSTMCYHVVSSPTERPRIVIAGKDSMSEAESAQRRGGGLSRRPSVVRHGTIDRGLDDRVRWFWKPLKGTSLPLTDGFSAPDYVVFLVVEAWASGRARNEGVGRHQTEVAVRSDGPLFNPTYSEDYESHLMREASKHAARQSLAYSGVGAANIGWPDDDGDLFRGFVQSPEPVEYDQASPGTGIAHNPGRTFEKPSYALASEGSTRETQVFEEPEMLEMLDQSLARKQEETFEETNAFVNEEEDTFEETDVFVIDKSFKKKAAPSGSGGNEFDIDQKRASRSVSDAYFVDQSIPVSEAGSLARGSSTPAYHDFTNGPPQVEYDTYVKDGNNPYPLARQTIAFPDSAWEPLNRDSSVSEETFRDSAAGSTVEQGASFDIDAFQQALEGVKNGQTSAPPGAAAIPKQVSDSSAAVPYSVFSPGHLSPQDSAPGEAAKVIGNLSRENTVLRQKLTNATEAVLELPLVLRKASLTEVQIREYCGAFDVEGYTDVGHMKEIAQDADPTAWDSMVSKVKLAKGHERRFKHALLSEADEVEFVNAAAVEVIALELANGTNTGFTESKAKEVASRLCQAGYDNLKDLRALAVTADADNSDFQDMVQEVQLSPQEADAVQGALVPVSAVEGHSAIATVNLS